MIIHTGTIKLPWESLVAQAWVSVIFVLHQVVGLEVLKIMKCQNLFKGPVRQYFKTYIVIKCSTKQSHELGLTTITRLRKLHNHGIYMWDYSYFKLPSWKAQVCSQEHASPNTWSSLGL